MCQSCRVMQKSSTMTAVRNAHGLVKEIANYSNESVKRTTALQSKISPSGMRTSKNVCPTRWVDGHSAIVRFVGLLHPVFDALEDLSTESGNTGSQVTMLLRSISSCELLVSFHVMEDMCGLLLPLSKHGPLYDSTWTGSSGCRPTRLKTHVAYSSSGLSCRSCSIPSLDRILCK